MKDLREIVKFESYDAACKKYVDDLHYIITKNRKFQDKLPVLMLSGGVDSMMLGCILKQEFGLEDSITVGCVQDTKDIKVSAPSPCIKSVFSISTLTFCKHNLNVR